MTGVDVVIVVQVPGHGLTSVTNTCNDVGEAQRWASWKVRRLEEEGFDVKDVIVDGEHE